MNTMRAKTKPRATQMMTLGAFRFMPARKE
jgi:hypothetical protein